MPAVAAPPAPGLTLAAFDGPDEPPDYVPPETTPEKDDPPPPAADKATVEAPPPVDDAPPEKVTDDPPEAAANLDEAMGHDVPDEDAAEKERIAAEHKAKDDAAAKAKADAEAPTAQRDSDLKVEIPHLQPKLGKLMREKDAKVIEARNARDQLAREKDELTAKLKAAEERAASVKVPAEVDGELKSLRERVKELDIAQDPELVGKYDTPIKANDERIIAVLKLQGFGDIKDEKTGQKVGENPKVIADLKKSGLTLGNLQPYIAALEKAGLVEDAEEIREGIRANRRLAQERQGEIDKWKGNYSQRQQERATASKQKDEQRNQAFRTHTDTLLKADLEALAKDFPYINRPGQPLAGDAPATVKAKQAAIEQWEADAKKIEAGVKAFNPDGVPPEKMPEVGGRINAAAIQAVVLKTHVLPRMLREAATATARIKELETELNAIKGAGRISRAQSSSPSDLPSHRPTPASLDEALGRGPDA